MDYCFTLLAFVRFSWCGSWLWLLPWNHRLTQTNDCTGAVFLRKSAFAESKASMLFLLIRGTRWFGTFEVASLVQHHLRELRNTVSLAAMDPLWPSRGLPIILDSLLRWLPNRPTVLRFRRALMAIKSALWRNRPWQYRGLWPLKVSIVVKHFRLHTQLMAWWCIVAKCLIGVISKELVWL
jgi:hypothetical protein